MPRIDALSRDDVADELLPILRMSDEVMGFTTNDVLTMARWPELLQALSPIVGTIYGPGEVSDELKRLVGLIASTSGGCRYCQAHTLHGAARAGASEDKLAAVWEFETSDLFSPAERAALRVARGGGSSPNGVTDEDFAVLREHFSERQILEIVAQIALFGFLNRWNDTLNTQLESEPREFAVGKLAGEG